MSDDHIEGDPVTPAPAGTSEFGTGIVVPVTVQVPVENLAAFYAAVGKWAQSADGPRGRIRVS